MCFGLELALASVACSCNSRQSPGALYCDRGGAPARSSTAKYELAGVATRVYGKACFRSGESTVATSRAGGKTCFRSTAPPSRSAGLAHQRTPCAGISELECDLSSRLSAAGEASRPDTACRSGWHARRHKLRCQCRNSDSSVNFIARLRLDCRCCTRRRYCRVVNIFPLRCRSGSACSGSTSGLGRSWYPTSGRVI